MFDKKNENIIIDTMKHDGFCKIDNVLLTPTCAIMLSNYHESIILQEQMDYQDRVTSYINRKYELNIKKEYNPKIVNLYNNGILVINQEEFPLKDFYIVYKDNHDYNIKCTNEKYENKDIDYDKAVKLIDTTAFIDLISNKDIILKDNRIIIENNTLLNIVKNWDGFLHSETKETDAIHNKKMIEDDTNEK